MARDTLYLSGNQLLQPSGTRVVLDGINVPLYDNWDFPPTDYLDEVAKLKINAVRLEWYANFPNDHPPVEPSGLDPVFAHCQQLGMTAILMLSDLTGAPDTSGLPTLTQWWTRADVVALLNKYKGNVILNLGNEVGSYRWVDISNDGQAQQKALTSFTNDYVQAIQAIRSAGLNMPLMIDAPDGGQTIEVFLHIGQQLIAADPQHNILLSAHAYWAGYDGMSPYVLCANSGLPIIFGEFANRQDEYDEQTQQEIYGYYALDGSGNGVPAENQFTYQELAMDCRRRGVHMLAWSWGPDNCEDRKISTDKTFAGLTPYGQEVMGLLHYVPQL